MYSLPSSEEVCFDHPAIQSYYNLLHRIMEAFVEVSPPFKIMLVLLEHK